MGRQVCAPCRARPDAFPAPARRRVHQPPLPIPLTPLSSNPNSNPLSTTSPDPPPPPLSHCSVLNLGTESHRRKYFDDIGAFRLPGCFAMTELAHGSNVRGAGRRGGREGRRQEAGNGRQRADPAPRVLCRPRAATHAPARRAPFPPPQVAALQTEAVLDVLTDEWVIHTPEEGAIKWWVGVGRRWLVAGPFRGWGAPVARGRAAPLSA
jgi:hypothetical protein